MDIITTNDLEKIELGTVQFIRTGASEESLSFYTLKDGKVFYYTDNGKLTKEEKSE